MKADFTLEGAEELRRSLKKLGINMDKEIQAVIDSTALAVRSYAVKSIQRGPASGVVYEKYQPRRRHQSSAPGQPPQSDTGRLASSVQIVTGSMESDVGTNVDYGRYLEFGTQNMQPRPWLIPAAESERRNYQRKLKAIKVSVK